MPTPDLAASSLSAVEAALAAGRDAAEADLMRLLAIPSVSADPAFTDGMAAAAAEVESQLKAAGCATEIVPTDGFPIVVGRTPEVAGAPTVLVYGHYDVQPPDPLEKWTTPPFEPTVRDGHVYARGATDDKGQMLTHVVAAGAWTRACGKPPVNVIFVIEGEEEVGSNNLDQFLESRREELTSDVAVISDTSQYGPGMPAITYGLRGIAAVEFTLKGPSHDLHSGLFGGTVANPATAAARLVATLHDDAGRVAVDGFYDGVLEVSRKERDQFAALPFDEATYLQGAGSTAPVGEAGYTTLERRWIRPTCEVNGIKAGYQGEGPKTIVPSEATVKLTCRLVPDQDPAAIAAALETHLRDRLPPGVAMEFKTYHGCPGFVLDPDGPHAHAASAAIDRAFGTAPVYIREGGSIPVVESLKRILSVDTLLLGWGQSTDALHSPDERFSLDAYHRGTHAAAALWAELAVMQSPVVDHDKISAIDTDSIPHPEQSA